MNDSWYKSFLQSITKSNCPTLFFSNFKNVNQLKGETNTRLIEPYPVKMEFVTTLPDTLLKIKAI